MNFDAAIIGAGIIGTACAFELAHEGLRVAVIEKDGIAHGTTAAAMGHIVTMDDSPAQLALTKYSRELWRKIIPELPRNCEPEACGTVWVAADYEELTEAQRKFSVYSANGINAEILDENSLYQAEPNLREGLAGGLYVPDDLVVYQPCAAQYFAEKAKENGTQFYIGNAVEKIENERVLLSDGSVVSAKVIINAAGHAAPKLTPSLNIVKRKGHLVITERAPTLIRSQLIELGYLKSAHGKEADSVAFNVQPRPNGQILLGSSRQFGVETLEVDHNILRRMTARASEYIPKLRKTKALRAWTGFRPCTPDNLPYIGETEKNIFVAAGHEGLGITTSLATAKLIADAILGRESAIDRLLYSPARIYQGDHND